MAIQKRGSTRAAQFSQHFAGRFSPVSITLDLVGKIGKDLSTRNLKVIIWNDILLQGSNILQLHQTSLFVQFLLVKPSTLIRLATVAFFEFVFTYHVHHNSAVRKLVASSHDMQKHIGKKASKTKHDDM